MKLTWPLFKPTARPVFWVASFGIFADGLATEGVRVGVVEERKWLSVRSQTGRSFSEISGAVQNLAGKVERLWALKWEWRGEYILATSLRGPRNFGVGRPDLSMVKPHPNYNWTLSTPYKMDDHDSVIWSPIIYTQPCSYQTGFVASVARVNAVGASCTHPTPPPDPRQLSSHSFHGRPGYYLVRTDISLHRLPPSSLVCLYRSSW